MEEHTSEERNFLLRVVQPGLAGLMDGTVSTLAPIFAAAFATHSSHVTLLIGFSTAVGAGISMAFAEALSDTGLLTGRGHPLFRGLIIGAMTFVGGIFHTVPFFISNVRVALYVAYGVVVCELIIISYLRRFFFKLNFFFSTVQVIVGGALVVLAGFLIGSA